MSKVSYRRYTDLPTLIQILTNSKLTLLNPSFWDDRNDSFFLSTYKEKMALQSVLALCFTRESETYHHWRVFSSGASGVCVNFNPEQLETAFAAVKGVKFKEVNYLTLKELRDNPPTIARLPFVKRRPYKHEKESRALWESESEKVGFLDVPIYISSITRITLSPWMHPSLRDNVVKLLKTINGCKSIPIMRSTLIENAHWKSYGTSAM